MWKIYNTRCIILVIGHVTLKQYKAYIWLGFDSKCKKNLLNLSSNKSLKIVLKFAVAIYILVCNSTGDKKTASEDQIS